jgi:hypothetical protein
MGGVAGTSTGGEAMLFKYFHHWCHRAPLWTLVLPKKESTLWIGQIYQNKSRQAFADISPEVDPIVQYQVLFTFSPFLTMY